MDINRIVNKRKRIERGLNVSQRRKKGLNERKW